ncbi:MAG: type I methionyl aminopeptidase [Bacteroidales bacterium]|nr:type I methionyl aminopeptidase [Bacteroidales bacterium]MBO5769043.1 type I methionyl aminopeptidase [Bacteroidales bacterium]MBO5818680.1 type I methionyl aminopeptidase [Bacteroidales bacterium]MBO5846341.1 type I methionyl aminopeptidase [Bacteroidales bacterium]MBO5916236.1 type I methionyl aminopeptidase [Bacteroidales bacterium]
MIYLKTDEEIELLRESNLIVARTLAEVAKYIQPGVTTKYLDQIGEDYIRSCGAVPSFLNYNGYPASLCISVNDVVVHGIPSVNQVLKDGDIVSVDCGAYKNGFHGDSSYTFRVGDVDEKVVSLLRVTKEALYLGIEQAVDGHRLGDVSNAVQNHCQRKGYSVVREMVGHGIGRHLHEEPEVPNYGKKGSGPMLKSGMVIAIEPMINMGNRHIMIERDGWTARTTDRKPSAHFEHTVAIRKGKADILSSFDYIKEVLGDRFI